MKRIVIRVIKRKAQANIAAALPTKRLRVRAATATTTVKRWIEESRKNKLEEDNSSREIIAGWTAEANT